MIILFFLEQDILWQRITWNTICIAGLTHSHDGHPFQDEEHRDYRLQHLTHLVLPTLKKQRRKNTDDGALKSTNHLYVKSRKGDQHLRL